MWLVAFPACHIGPPMHDSTFWFPSLLIFLIYLVLSLRVLFYFLMAFWLKNKALFCLLSRYLLLKIPRKFMLDFMASEFLTIIQCTYYNLRLCSEHVSK